MAALEPGSPAPALHLPGARGEDHTVTFNSLTLLAFFKHNCPVCQMALPYVQRFSSYMDSGLDVLAIAEDPADLALAFAERYDVSLPMALDTAPYAASEAYGLTNVPTLFLVDKGGRVVRNQVSFSKDGYNAISAEIARRTGAPYVEVCPADDGAPAFKPG